MAIASKHLEVLRECYDQKRSITNDDLGELLGEIDSLERMNDIAWGIISNAYGGDWDLAHKEWKGAAENFSDYMFSKRCCNGTLPVFSTSEIR